MDDTKRLLAILHDPEKFIYTIQHNGPAYLHWTGIWYSSYLWGTTSLHEAFWATEVLEQYGQSLEEQDRHQRKVYFNSVQDIRSLFSLNASRYEIKRIRAEGKVPEHVITEVASNKEIFRTNVLKYGY